MKKTIFNGLPFVKIAISSFHAQHSPFQPQHFITWLEKIKVRGADAVLIREFEWTFYDKLSALEIASQHHLIPILHQAEQDVPFGYYHWAHTFLHQKPDFQGVHGISCHSIEEVQQAEANGFDYAFLSPIYPTTSHPDRLPLGIPYLKHCVQQSNLPIIALGGITSPERAQKVQQAGAYGLASLSLFH